MNEVVECGYNALGFPITYRRIYFRNRQLIEFVIEKQSINTRRWMLLSISFALIFYVINLNQLGTYQRLVLLIFLVLWVTVLATFKVKKESLLISSFGLQITTTSFIGKKASLFLETDSVDAVAIHEGISMGFQADAQRQADRVLSFLDFVNEKKINWEPTGEILCSAYLKGLEITPRLSVSSTRTINKDKGWNDPPVISYSVASSTRTKKSNLTKRVVFPNSVVHDKPTLPFAVQSAPPALFPNETGNSTDKTLDVTHTDTDNCLQDDHIDEDMHKKTVDILNQCLARLTTLQKNIAADVTRRIEIFSRMWIEGKLHSDVQIKMHQCSIALWNGDYSKADSIHVTLMVDHCNQVSPWMVAIKRLIRECEKNNIQIANDDCSNLCTSESVDNKQD